MRPFPRVAACWWKALQSHYDLLAWSRDAWPNPPRLVPLRIPVAFAPEASSESAMGHLRPHRSGHQARPRRTHG